MFLFRKNKEKKITNLLLDAKIGLERCNKAEDFEEYIFNWDYATNALKQLLPYANDPKFTGNVVSEYNRLMSEEQWHFRDAIENNSKKIISDTKGKYRNNLSMANFECEDFADVINKYYDRFDDETKVFATRIVRETFSKCGFNYNEQNSDENLNTTASEDFDNLEGLEFEYWCANLLRENGFVNVEVTKASGDQGVDILAEKNEIKYAIQCKCYSTDLGNSPVQEIYAGKSMYRCQVGAVMTNSHFTSGAKELAEATGVLLWDREKLIQMLSNIDKSKVENENNTLHKSKLESYKDYDSILEEAINCVVQEGFASTSLIQKKLKIGYARAARIIDEMEELGIISTYAGAKPREILMSKDEILNILNK